MRRQIPNFLTLLNLFSGSIAIVMAFQGDFKGVVIWIAIAALFDFLDGLAARLLKAYSSLGKELDSLADVVSFGVAPASAVFILIRDWSLIPGYLEFLQPWLPYMAFLIPVFSAYRLAKFNIDERQTNSFIGLPTPANALFWISYCYGIHQSAAKNEHFFYLTAAFIIVMSLLMISEIPMFSLKIKKATFKGNEKQILLLLLVVLFIVLQGVVGISWGIAAYILLSIVCNKKKTNR